MEILFLPLLLGGLGLFIGGIALLVIAHNWPPSAAFTVKLERPPEHDDADDWKNR